MSSQMQASTRKLFHCCLLTVGQETCMNSTKLFLCWLTLKSMVLAQIWHLKLSFHPFQAMVSNVLQTNFDFLISGWSEAAHKTGLNTATTARIFNKLMTQRLKFKKYIAQGGDWGSAIVSNIGRFFPQNVYGIHVNMVFAGMNKGSTVFRLLIGSVFPSLVFSSPKYASYSFKSDFLQLIKESGYFHLQATKPDTG